MNWSLLFSDFVTENGKKHRHAIVVLVLLLDIALNTIIGLTPYIDNFTRTSRIRKKIARAKDRLLYHLLIYVFRS
jgi:hypothetical protein